MTNKNLTNWKRQAKQLRKATGSKHMACLDQIAQVNGFSNWKDAVKQLSDNNRQIVVCRGNQIGKTMLTKELKRAL